MPKETELQTEFVKDAKKQFPEGVFYKTNNRFIAGPPDIIGHPKVFKSFYCEMKKLDRPPKGNFKLELTANQRRWMHNLQRAGINAFWAVVWTLPSQRGRVMITGNDPDERIVDPDTALRYYREKGKIWPISTIVANTERGVCGKPSSMMSPRRASI